MIRRIHSLADDSLPIPPSDTAPVIYRRWLSLLCGACSVVVACCFVASPAAAGWTVTPRNSVALAAGTVTNIRELSGVTYLGPQPGGLERFAAIQDENGRIVLVDVAFAANGSITSATAAGAVTIGSGSDHEGIAYTGSERNSVFVSEENTPTVREFQLPGGEFLGAVSLPAVFSTARGNRGLESLTRSLDGRTMWTANEEALGADGPVSSQGGPTTVRLQQLLDNGSSVSLGPQFAYDVDPIHAGSNPDRSGLPDLVSLPDDSLLALERSRIGSGITTSFRNRIYHIDFSGATDISGEEYSDGLLGDVPEFFPVNKGQPLWSAQSIGINNLEGLGLGPILSNGNWVLLGVADGGDTGINLISSFELSLSDCSLAGDYNCSGAVDDADYRLWANTFGTSSTAADGNGNGVVDAADYTVWRDHVGASLGAAAGAKTAAAVPEPGGIALSAFNIACGLALSRKRR